LAFAAGGGGQEGKGDSGKIKDLLYRCLNFALLVIILFVEIKKTTATRFLSARREEISKMFDDLRRDRADAENRYKELEKKLKEFEKTKKEIIEQFREEGAAEKDKIIAEAKERAKQILAQADLTIEREIQAARDKLMERIIDVSAQKAQEIIAKEIKDSDQDQLVNDFIKKVEKLH
jgi:F-type H+-transporting ATPase subunit b